MKTLSKFLLTAALVANVPSVPMALAQSRPPQAVADAFKLRYPEVTHPSWSREKGRWEAEFKENGSQVSAEFTSDGRWQGTESVVEQPSLPVTTAFNKAYPGTTRVRWEMTETADGKTLYEARFRKGLAWYRVLYDRNGCEPKCMPKARPS